MIFLSIFFFLHILERNLRSPKVQTVYKTNRPININIAVQFF